MVLYLPVQEGGQGPVDIVSRITAFRLQTAQRLLYSFGLPWMDVACVLLRIRQTFVPASAPVHGFNWSDTFLPDQVLHSIGKL